MRNPKDENHIALFGIDAEKIPQEKLNAVARSDEKWSKFKITRKNRKEEQSILYSKQCMPPSLWRFALGESIGNGKCELIVEHKMPDNQVFMITLLRLFLPKCIVKVVPVFKP